jgi:caffeoyl-CoA O-methyltransferase
MMKRLIDPALDDYATHHSIPPSALAQELESYTYQHCRYPQMVTGALEGALLKMLIRLTGAKRVIEIGLFTGYSALAMAETLPDDGRIVSCEINKESATIAKSFFERSPHGHKIEIKIGPALDTLTQLEAPIDLVFLDADKENYVKYYDAVLPKLRNGGLLVADNVLWSGRVLQPEQETDRAIVAFNDRVQKDERVENVLLTVRDGVMVVRKMR